MLGDGETSYDYGTDGDSTSLAACSVSLHSRFLAFVGSNYFTSSHPLLQLGFRKSSVATKLKITYMKDNFLEVRVTFLLSCIPDTHDICYT
jgi:hypothetical protein